MKNTFDGHGGVNFNGVHTETSEKKYWAERKRDFLKSRVDRLKAGQEVTRFVDRLAKDEIEVVEEAIKNAGVLCWICVFVLVTYPYV